MARFSEPSGYLAILIMAIGGKSVHVDDSRLQPALRRWRLIED
jgi:hypothetical protein